MVFPKLNDIKNIFYSDIGDRYEKDYPDNILLAKQAFHELMKYLWLSQKLFIEKSNNAEQALLDFQATVFSSMKEIDDMWHTFILFTKDYTSFCQEYYGKYLHHQPTVKEEYKNIRDNFDDYLLKTGKWIAYIYDNLGEETVRLWFKDYLA